MQYYVRGKIAKSGQETFYNYAKRIGTLTLGHPSSNHRVKRTISPQVFLRLGQLQGLANGSLLPSLRRLQICTSDGSYLDHLDLFLSPSLKSLELSKMPTNVGHSSSIILFLDNTAEVSPDLETLILGPFELPQKLLDPCVKFRQLQRLELRGVSFSTTGTILGDIGSLEHLKEFILEELKEPPPIQFVVSEAPEAPPVRNASAPCWGWTPPHDPGSPIPTIPGLPPSPVLEPSPFPLRPQTPISFEFGWGNYPVDGGSGTTSVVGFPISDRQPRSSPIEPPTAHTPTLRTDPVDSLRLGKPNVVNSTVSDKRLRSDPPGISDSSGLRSDPFDMWGTFMATSVTGSPISERRPLLSTMSKLFPSLRALQIIGTSDLIEMVVNAVTSPDLCKISITFTTITRKMRTMKRKKKKNTESTVFILNNAIERWASLISVVVTADAGKTASLPNDVLRDLLLQPELKRLEINGFDISSIDSAFPELVDEAYSSQLETLLLPVTNSVPLSRLRHIAMAWPYLTSLRCKLDSASSVQPIGMDPISHKLHSLTVASDDQSSPVQHVRSSRLLKIAAYIDCLFPDLTEMDVVDGAISFLHEPEWVQVFDMVKLLQTVRAHDRQRFI